MGAPWAPQGPPPRAENETNLGPKMGRKRGQDGAQNATQNGKLFASRSGPTFEPKNVRKWSPNLEAKIQRNKRSSSKGRKVISSKHSITFAHFCLLEGTENPSKKSSKSDQKMSSSAKTFENRKITKLGLEKRPFWNRKRVQKRSPKGYKKQ